MSIVRKTAPVAVHELYPSEHRRYRVLDGTWSFVLDPSGTGEQNGLAASCEHYDDTITVPGCLEAQGKGITYAEPERPGWWGTSDKPYLGVSWAAISFDAPGIGPDEELWLHFGGVATEADVYLNGEKLCHHEYAIIPFGLDITHKVKPGVNFLAVRVENTHKYERAPENHNGLGSTALEIMWSGIYRSVELVTMDRRHMERMTLRWNGEELSAVPEWSGPAPENAGLRLKIADMEGRIIDEAETECCESLCWRPEAPRLWNPQDPYLYRFTLEAVDESGRVFDSLSERFGLRVLKMIDGKPAINGIPVYLRGDMVHYHWPVTVSAPVDREDIREKLAHYKEYGLNFLRHHTHFPSPEYMETADELGLLCHNELGLCGGLWGIEEAYRDELWKLAITRDRNHPSAIVWCMGNEKQFPRESVLHFANIARSADPTRFLLSDSPGWIVEEDDSMVRWPVMHEFRMSGGSYLDLRREEKYTTSFQRPWRMMYTRKCLEEQGLLAYAGRFADATAKLQRECRKILLEEVRENSVDVEELFNLHGVDYTGFVMCTFRDTGSFMWGTVDDLYGQKVTPPEVFQETVNDTVLLFGLKWHHRVFKTTEGRPWMPLVFSVSHYGREPVENGKLIYRVVGEGGNVLYSGEKTGLAVPVGTLKCLETAVYIYDNVPDVCQKLTVEAVLSWNGSGGLQSVTNHWNVWLAPAPSLSEEVQQQIAVDVSDPWLYTQLSAAYPRAGTAKHDDCAILVTDRLDEACYGVLRRGGRVLLLGQNHFKAVVTEFGSARSEFDRGTLIADHPLFKRIPHDGWCDVPFAGLISENRALEGNRNAAGCVYELEKGWPEDLEPLIMGIPSYKSEKPAKQAHLLEVMVGDGRLMASPMKFGSPFAQSAFDLFFLDEILQYMAGEEFAPRARMSEEALRSVQTEAPSYLQMSLRDVNVFRSEVRG